MKKPPVFARRESVVDARLEREFRRTYHEPGVRYLQIAFLLGALSFGGLLLIDLVHGSIPAMPGASVARGLVVLGFMAALLAVTVRRNFASRYYTAIANAFIAFGMLATALLPIAVHGNKSNSDIYWSLSSSLSTAVVLIYGLSRLTAKNTALIVVSGSLLGLGTSFMVPHFDWYHFARLAFLLTLVNLAAFSLRETVERRERQLFMLARENLSRNIYARQLDAARQLAEEGNEVKLRFLANMSHEFRTPMHGVMQTLEIVARDSSPEMAGIVGRALHSGEALLAKLNSILDYTRWTQTGLTPSPARVSLSATAREITERHRKAADDRRLELSLRIDLASSQDIVLTDGIMLVEVMDRLLDNAIRFTLAGHVKVDVELKRHATRPYPAARLEVVVADSGIGIPELLHRRVFTPFFQADDASNRRVGGTGLGLAIVKRLIDVMDGSVELISQPGSGTSLRVSIPVEIAQSRHAAAPSKPASGRQARNLGSVRKLAGNALLVEDNHFNAELAAELLSRMGLAVRCAFDGEQACQAADSARFDIILMDCQMPIMDGYEATRLIRKSELARCVVPAPIIAITANALAGDREKCLAAGMDDYLAKPYGADQLREKLETWLPIADDSCPPPQGDEPSHFDD